MKSYYLGDKALSGFARQQIDENGELKYKGVMHLFGSKVPIYFSLEPCDRYVKGEKVYKVLTYLAPMVVKKKWVIFDNAIKVASKKRFQAIRHVEKIVKDLGVAYEYYESTKEKEENSKCRKCRKQLEAEWRKRLREAVSSNVERQREIRKRQVQKLLARRKGNKRTNS